MKDGTAVHPFVQSFTKGFASYHGFCFGIDVDRKIDTNQVIQIAEHDAIGNRCCLKVKFARRQSFECVEDGSTEADDANIRGVDPAFVRKSRDGALVGCNGARSLLWCSSSLALPDLQRHDSGRGKLFCRKRTCEAAAGHKSVGTESVGLDDQRISDSEPKPDRLVQDALPASTFLIAPVKEFRWAARNRSQLRIKVKNDLGLAGPGINCHEFRWVGVTLFDPQSLSFRRFFRSLLFDLPGVRWVAPIGRPLAPFGGTAGLNDRNLIVAPRRKTDLANRFPPRLMPITKISLQRPNALGCRGLDLNRQKTRSLVLILD